MAENDSDDDRSQFAKDYNISRRAEKLLRFQFAYSAIGITIALIVLIVVNIVD